MYMSRKWAIMTSGYGLLSSRRTLTSSSDAALCGLAPAFPWTRIESAPTSSSLLDSLMSWRLL